MCSIFGLLFFFIYCFFFCVWISFFAFLACFKLLGIQLFTSLLCLFFVFPPRRFFLQPTVCCFFGLFVSRRFCATHTHTHATRVLCLCRPETLGRLSVAGAWLVDWLHNPAISYGIYSISEALTSSIYTCYLKAKLISLRVENIF